MWQPLLRGRNPMRLLPVVCAALLVAGTPAVAGSKNVKPVKAQVETVELAARSLANPRIAGIWEEDFTDPAGREWRRSLRPNGVVKEVWTDGYCRIERVRSNGRTSETLSC
jgi:hypothetical protein